MPRQLPITKSPLYYFELSFRIMSSFFPHKNGIHVYFKCRVILRVSSKFENVCDSKFRIGSQMEQSYRSIWLKRSLSHFNWGEFSTSGITFTSSQTTWWGTQAARSDIIVYLGCCHKVGREKWRVNLKRIKTTHADPVCPVQNFSFIDFSPQLFQLSHHRADSKVAGRGNGVDGGRLPLAF